MNIPAYVQHQTSLFRTRSAHHQTFIPCRHHAIRTNSVFGRERLLIGTTYPRWDNHSASWTKETLGMVLIFLHRVHWFISSYLFVNSFPYCAYSILLADRLDRILQVNIVDVDVLWANSSDVTGRLQPFLGLYGGGAVASWVVRSSPDRAVQAGDIVLCSWERHITLTVPLFTQVYKWVLDVTLRWTSIQSSRFMLRKPG